MSKTFKYALYGLLVDLCVLLAVLLFSVVMVARDYRGRCFSLMIMGGSPAPSCTFGQYMARAVEFIVVIGFLLAVESWYVSVPVLLAAPALGFALGWRSESRG
ncbi:MAG TPA: hypothetical protein VGX48_00285 [Pyrinomonadaceae bacterium]|jgi:hypothetical protein|nr:hypothetical protein [Pyrinomonadaceae bacterium]